MAEFLETTPLRDALDDALQSAPLSSAGDFGGQRPRRAAPVGSDFVRRVHSYEVLNQYVVGGQWRALALASAASIIEVADNRRQVLRYWVYRSLALMRMGAQAQAERELARLATSIRVSQWPFELRVLRAQATSSAMVSADRLSALLRACRRSLPVDQQRVFRVSLMLARCAMELRGDSALALRIVDQLTATGDDPLVMSAAARLCLQLGAIPKAEALFVAVENMAPSVDDTLVRMNRALYAVAAGKWAAARELFDAVAEAHPPGEGAGGVAAGNNRALCDLYLGNPQAMLSGLQKLMGDAPAAAGASEVLVFNYCTGLDLHYDGGRLRDAKTKKLVEVATWAGDGFDVASFKLT
ncbi:hypothetical protein GGI21_004133 [Coemansia aciculifera]|nr:hypothetical protein GGI21_004133 [Coemansia aciculifera]